uniref:Methyltransferase type 11 domain-containing protein n=1 Tax=viral metagenome TaxID=1070528 RepID=A0A6C0JPS2_9ZZZZ
MILYILIFLLLLYFSVSYFRKEGYENNNTEYKTFINNNIYNKFYTKNYDDMIHTAPYESDVIKKLSDYFDNNTNLLVTGTKTGHIIELLKGMEITGMDNSEAMVQMSKYKYPDNNYVYGDYENKNVFNKNTFTHILCPLFTIYTVDMDIFLENCNNWLIHKGYMFIVYFKDGFDIKNITNHYPSDYFKLNYTYDIELKKSIITEKITNNKFDVRTNKLFLNDISNLDNSAMKNGFRVINTIDVPDLPNAYIMILQKY